MYSSIGLDRIHKAMAGYVKSISKRNEGDDKEKTLPIASLGGSMVLHGEDFDAYSEYGRCLTSKSTSCYLSYIYISEAETDDSLFSVWAY